MGKATSGPPLLFRSKLLCFSLLYLFSSLFLALYSSLSSTKCLIFFRSYPSDYSIQTHLFSYPPTYGEHKYAVPTLRSSCDSHVNFSGSSHNCNVVNDFPMDWTRSFVFSSLNRLRPVDRLWDGFEGNPRILQKFISFPPSEVHAGESSEFWRKFHYPEEDFLLWLFRW